MKGVNIMKLNENTINTLSALARYFNEQKNTDTRRSIEDDLNSFIWGVEIATDNTITPIWKNGNITRILCNNEIVCSFDR